MKRIITICVLSFFMLIALNSCQASSYTNESFSLESDQDSTYLNVSDNVTEESTQIPDYIVEKLDITYTFEDLVTTFFEMYDVNISDDYSVFHNYESQDGRLIYIGDYTDLIDYYAQPVIGRISDSTDNASAAVHTPNEYEYHIMHRLYVDGLGINVFDDEYWAEECFRSCVNSAIVDGSILDDNLFEDGYCFILDESDPTYREFYAYYYIGDYMIDYLYIVGYEDVEHYTRYLEICEELGLPTSDQVTNEVLN